MTMKTNVTTAVLAGAALAMGSAGAQEPSKSDQARQTAATQGTTDGTSRQKSTTSNDRAAPVMFMLMVPVAVETKTNDALANGCWAKLYDGYNYAGDSFTIVGPSDMADMTGPFGVDWEDKISSIKTGPRATVTIYDNENFRDRAATVKPGQEVPQITEKMGLFEEFNSMRIKCDSAGAK